uniref:ARAD1C22286p n=1 Tax=Blastobotrys adeninivorans TaxID=409370 RepID=A0A060T1P4_BLAAD
MASHEEDELDDLDDLLDDFTDEVLSKPPGSLAQESSKEPQEPSSQDDGDDAKAAPSTTDATTEGRAESKSTGTSEGANAATQPSSGAAADLDEEFAKKLKLGVDQLLAEMGDDPEAKQSFEALMAGISQSTGSDGATGAKGTGSSAAPSSSSAGGFQDTISQTMNRLKESRQDLDEQQSQFSSEADFLAKMMKELESASGSGDGMDMTNLLDEMLQELSSKEILYEPIKEMNDKYPAWLEKNGNSLPKDELERYKKQQKIVREICQKFEAPDYSDSDAETRKFITDRMQEMQDSGAPPQALMGDLAAGAIPGLEGDKLPDDLENCNVQ